MREYWFNFVLTSLALFTPVCSQNHSCRTEETFCKPFVDYAIANYPNYRHLHTADLIELFGYPVEAHKIHTKDGYILTVQRIPYSNRSPQSTSKVPVFVQHGLFSSSATWFWQPADRALVFMLADAGYDVWIGNARGTHYSSEHETLSWDDPTDLRYWNFSAHEIGKYDVPATVNYIISTSRQGSIYYICHSIGCHQFFVGVILNPDLNPKIRTFFGMAPAIYKGNTTNAIFNAAKPIFSQYPVYKIVNRINKGRFLPEILTEFLGSLINLCSNGVVNCGLCANIYVAMNNFDPCQANFTTLPGFLIHHPESTSAKVFSHAMQDTKCGTFREYDYGAKKNLEVYGRRTPPNYDWSKVNLPVVIYSGKQDNGVVEKDVAKLAGALGSNLVERHVVEYENWTHLNFVIGKDADKYVYQRIINVMNNRTYDRVRP